MKNLNLRFEQLEQRIAPGTVCCDGKYDDCKDEGKKEHCNNGWGNGEDCAPGNSLANQPKFEDPDTGPSPSNSPASADGDR
jgi:hypothetical protein